MEREFAPSRGTRSHDGICVQISSYKVQSFFWYKFLRFTVQVLPLIAERRTQLDWYTQAGGVALAFIRVECVLARAGAFCNLEALVALQVCLVALGVQVIGAHAPFHAAAAQVRVLVLGGDVLPCVILRQSVRVHSTVHLFFVLALVSSAASVAEFRNRVAGL